MKIISIALLAFYLTACSKDQDLGKKYTNNFKADITRDNSTESLEELNTVEMSFRPLKDSSLLIRASKINNWIVLIQIPRLKSGTYNFGSGSGILPIEATLSYFTGQGSWGWERLYTSSSTFPGSLTIEVAGNHIEGTFYCTTIWGTGTEKTTFSNGSFSGDFIVTN